MKTKTVRTSVDFGTLPKTKTLRMYFKKSTRKDIKDQLGFGELYLLEAILDSVNIPNNKLSDKKLAKNENMPVRLVQKYRLALQKANLFREFKTTKNNIQHIMYFVGKEAIYSTFFFPDLFGSGVDSIWKVKKNFSFKEITKIINMSPIKPQEKKDIYELLGNEYKGYFETEEAV